LYWDKTQKSLLPAVRAVKIFGFAALICRVFLAARSATKAYLENY
jgi:hypothetical protein